MGRTKKTVSIITLAFTLCFLSYNFCYFIAENYFFDKFFYQKSVKYGYWSTTNKHSPSLEDFGDRSQDLISLDKKKPDPYFMDDNYYKIVIYGDSYGWGQGVKNENRFAKILEEKLNKIRPTKIYSLSESGDNIFDHYQKFKLAPKIIGHINLHIFALYYNDLLFSHPEYNRYQTSQFLESQQYFNCTGPKIIDDFSGLQVADSLKPDSQNYCVYKKIIPLFPKNNAIYFDLGLLTDTSTWPNPQNFTKIISEDLKIFSPYSSEILSAPHPNKYNVSLLDSHPSVLANKYYAQALYNEITSNPQWNFH